MKALRKLLLLAGSAALLVPAMAAQQATTTPSTMPPEKKPLTINQRQRNQQRRIAQGVKSGQLTAAETARLERREAGIERREQKMRASGGKFTKGERRAINKQLNSTSRQIYREKHDKQTRH